MLIALTTPKVSLNKMTLEAKSPNFSQMNSLQIWARKWKRPIWNKNDKMKFFSSIMNASCFTHARNDPTCKDKCWSISGKFKKHYNYNVNTIHNEDY